ncbi:MAG: undecaprenyl diphosphate synthase family protein [Nitrososphaerota archaeon]|jgi:undecaprenyl diphosphate synthase|nr:undecaprenyl diphosphate synthase family protein [Nitrososphaerota archaeon]
MKINAIHIICDGNRTYSILNNHINDLETFAYNSAWKELEYIIRTSIKYFDIKYMIFTVTIRKNHLNQKRAESVKPISLFLGDHYRRIRKTYSDYEVKAKFIGDVNLFIKTSEKPDFTMRMINLIEDKTKNNDKYFVFYQVAYDTIFEYLKVLSKYAIDLKNNDLYENKLKMDYYDINIPDVDLSIRTMRPRLSNTTPILIGEYADFYFFPAPFPLLRKNHLALIIKDALLRKESKGGSFIYKKEDIDAIRKYTFDDFYLKPMYLGKKVSRVWLPILSKTKK